MLFKKEPMSLSFLGLNTNLFLSYLGKKKHTHIHMTVKTCCIFVIMYFLCAGMWYGYFTGRIEQTNRHPNANFFSKKGPFSAYCHPCIKSNQTILQEFKGGVTIKLNLHCQLSWVFIPTGFLNSCFQLHSPSRCLTPLEV